MRRGCEELLRGRCRFFRAPEFAEGEDSNGCPFLAERASMEDPLLIGDEGESASGISCLHRLVRGTKAGRLSPQSVG